jgi:diamine N-acetyltransferase
MHIRHANLSDAAVLAMLVSEANKEVAIQFGLNAENCPKHPSLCTPEWIANDFARGERYFILEDGGIPVACVATECPNPEVAYLNRLSVLPSVRHQGHGARLVRFIIEHTRRTSAKSISIGVIGEHTVLQAWYAKLGFNHGETKRFPHLPFSVKYMSYAIQGD